MPRQLRRLSGSGPRPPRPARRGFTLLEVSISLVIVAVIITSLGSVIVLASKALPSAPGVNGSTLSASLALEQLGSELRYAKSVTEAGPAAVTFTLADRDSDTVDETVRYEWAGSGSPLTRAYNAQSPAAVSPPLSSFALSYSRAQHTTTQVGTTTWDSGEVQFAGLSTLGALAIPGTITIGTATWGAEAFTIDRVSLPADTTRLAITRVSLKLRRPSSGTAGATIAVHLPSSPGSSIPASAPIGTVCSIPAASLTTSFAWVDATFSDVEFPNASTKDFVIVCKGIATGSASMQYQSLSTALADSNVVRWTTNSGGSWSPTLNLNLQDAPFAVYGRYQRQIVSNVSADSYTLSAASIALQATASSATRIETAVETLNDPAIPAP